MNLNFKQLPQLFKKLVGTNSGSIAKGVANSADNVAKSVTSNLDDVGKLYGEHMLTPKSEAFADALIDSPLFKSSGKQSSQLGFDDTPLDALLPDDMPTSISFDDIADTYRNRIPIDKPPVSPKEFVQNYKTDRYNKRYGEMMDGLFPNHFQIGDPADAPLPKSPPKTNEGIENYVSMRDAYADHLEHMGYPNNFDYDKELYNAGYKFDSTPDYDAMDIRPERFGQSPHPIDRLLYPDGFENPEDFARYYDSLERGYITSETPPYLYPTHSKVPWRSPARTSRELSVIQQALDPYAVSGDVSANSPNLSKLYKKMTGTY